MPLDRRRFVRTAAYSAASAMVPRLQAHGLDAAPGGLLRVPGYDQAVLLGGIGKTQQDNAQSVLDSFDEDALLKPFRAMGGMRAPGREIGGWYEYLPDYNWHNGDAGFAPGHCFGQWTSGMARFAVMQSDARARNRVLALHRGFAECITPNFFDKTRFPAYTLDKFNVGLLDAHTLLQSPDALAIANKVRQCALPSLPGSAMDRDTMPSWRSDRDQSWHWDESYTLPENLYLLYMAGAGSQYRSMARAYLLDTFFDRLAQEDNVLGGLHGYSHVNALSSAMQAFFVDGSRMHLAAARNGYRMIEAQSYATGGWAPDELFEKPGSGTLLASLKGTHNSFETPCGTYAVLKLSRSLLQLTRDGHFGDLMERVVFNSMFGALPLQPDGRTFYYADVNEKARRVYSAHRWPCCAGTYVQVAADYGINAYLLDPAPEIGLWVNLYLPSRIVWQAGDGSLSLTQEGGYPLSERVTMSLTADRPTRFTLRLRIPSWCTNPTITVNKVPQRIRIQQGFAAMNRVWRAKDVIEIDLPARLRLDPLPADGASPSNFAAVCSGPLVLLADRPTTLSRGSLTRILRTGEAEWQLREAGSRVVFRPIFAVGDAPYTTYMNIADETLPDRIQLHRQ